MLPSYPKHTHIHTHNEFQSMVNQQFFSPKLDVTCNMHMLHVTFTCYMHMLHVTKLDVTRNMHTYSLMYKKQNKMELLDQVIIFHYKLFSKTWNMVQIKHIKISTTVITVLLMSN